MMTTTQQRTFRHGHSSGRFDRSESSLAALLAQMTASSDLITGTEVDGPRTRALHEKGWAHHSGRNGDAASLFTAWEKATWTSIAVEEHYVTSQRYTRVGGAQAPRQEVLVTFLRHTPSGGTLLILLGHYPAGIEGHGTKYGIYNSLTRRVGVSVSAIFGTRKLKKELKKKFKPNAVMVGGDWNLNIGRSDVRAFFKMVFPVGNPNFTQTPVMGTLGKRVIDLWFLWRLALRQAPRIHPTNASDHRWYDEVLMFK